MQVEITITDRPIRHRPAPPPELVGRVGAWAEFTGLVRAEEADRPVAALEYEAYAPMAERVMRELVSDLALRHPCLFVHVTHRVGVVPVGEAALHVVAASGHRAAAFALLTEFLDRLKRDVPIWKRRALPLAAADASPRTSPANPVSADSRRRLPAVGSLDEALADIRARCSPLPPERVSLAEAFGRVLRETVSAPEDLPSFDRSAVDGYALRRDDAAIQFRVVDCLRAGDWRPRALQAGEAVRIATGGALPGDGLQVVMQEDAQCEGEVVRLLRRSDARHIRYRGEDLRQGQPLVRAGLRLDAGALALLASVGHAEPLVSPRLRVLHLTTGDELVPPDLTPKPGQIRDSNSILIGSLLRGWPCEVEHRHLPEDFEVAWSSLDAAKVAGMDLLLVSGGASVGERDFTGALLERLGFEMVFGQIKARPGKPTIFGVNGTRVAFGLPGNPLAHFVCFHLEVATALARLLGAAETPQFLRGQLAVELRDESCPRETLWPARLEWSGTAPRLRPLVWNSSGDITCLVDANALVRVPAQCEGLDAGAEVDFVPVIPLAASQSTRPDET